MKWRCYILYFQQDQEPYVFFKVRELLSGLLVDYTSFFERGFIEAYCLKLYILGKEDDHISIRLSLNAFRKADLIFKQYKIKETSYIAEKTIFGGPESISFIEYFFVKSSKVTLCLLFNLDDNTYYSYFNVLFRSLVLNYITVKTILPSNELIPFFNFSSVQNYCVNETSINHSRFDVDQVKLAFDYIDIQQILTLVDDNMLDIDIDLEYYQEACLELRCNFNLLRDGNEIQYPLHLFPNLQLINPMFTILYYLLDKNDNRLGVLGGEQKFISNVTKQALIKMALPVVN